MPSMRNLSVGVVALAALAAAACGDERSVTSEPVGALGFGINFARTATNLPRGTVTFPATVTATGAAPGPVGPGAGAVGSCGIVSVNTGAESRIEAFDIEIGAGRKTKGGGV